VSGGRSEGRVGSETLLNSSAARSEVLRRIRAAKGASPEAATVERGWRDIERKYRRSATRDRNGVLELFEDRLRDYDAHVMRAQRSEVVGSVAAMLRERSKRRIIVPPGLTPESLPEGFSFIADDGASAMELDKFDGVLTGATVAIAETGSIVLQNVAGQGRRAVTLVPDYHLCLVRIEDVVESVPEAMDRLQATADLPTTFFSGPSATADIEMTRIKGVHGPRFLDVILIG
jgi:L-lactate dehydrogenase complex protein LldG